MEVIVKGKWHTAIYSFAEASDEWRPKINNIMKGQSKPVLKQAIIDVVRGHELEGDDDVSIVIYIALVQL